MMDKAVKDENEDFKELACVTTLKTNTKNSSDETLLSAERYVHIELKINATYT